MKEILFLLRVILTYLFLSIGCFLMMRIIIGYTGFELDVQFLEFKQEYIHNQIWLAAFYIHVFSAVIALFAGFSQFSKSLFKKHRKLHRLIGKIYVANILFINVPTGMILAVNANGLFYGRLAFVILDCLWFWFTYKAYKDARNRDFVGHKNNMIRSYALTFSAITLRTWHMLLAHYFVIDRIDLYVMEAWLGFVPNLLVAEMIIRWKRK